MEEWIVNTDAILVFSLAFCQYSPYPHHGWRVFIFEDSRMRKNSIGQIFFDGPFSQVLRGVGGGGRARVKFDESLQNFL